VIAVEHKANPGKLKAVLGSNHNHKILVLGINEKQKRVKSNNPNIQATASTT